MGKSYCSSSLCFNNFNFKSKNGLPMKYYRLPRSVEIQAEYRKILKTAGINWKSGHICAAHWSNGVRSNTNDLPYIAVPEDQLQKIHSKYINAKKVFESSKNPTDKQNRTFKTAKRKYEVAQQISTNKIKKRKQLFKHSTPAPKKPRQMSKAKCHKELDTSNNIIGSLEQELQKANEIIDAKTQKIEKLKNELKTQQTTTMNLEIKNLHLLGAIENLL